MKTFLTNKEDPAAEPLLAATTSSTATSPSENNEVTAATSGPLKTLLLSPLSSLPRQSPAPNPSPKPKRKTPPPPLHSSIAQGTVHNPEGRTKQQQGRKKDPSYRQRGFVSPIAITLKRRSTTLLPSCVSSTKLSDMIGTMQCNNASRGSLSGHGDDDAIKKTRSGGISSRSSRARSNNSNYKQSFDNICDDFGVEHKLVALRKPQLRDSKEHHRASRGRTSTYPGMLRTPPPIQEAKIRAHEKKKSAPVDIDEVSRDPSCTTGKAQRSSSLHALGHVGMEKVKPSNTIAAPRKGRDGNYDVSTSHSAPTEAELRGELSWERLDTERLLSQMGMDVTEEDYCIEGQFIASSRSNNDTQKIRCHSYDCNYNHPLENAYEDFAVERKLVELKRPEQEEAHNNKILAGVCSMRRIVKNSLGNIGNNNSDGRESNRKHHNGHNHVRDKSPNNSKVLKSKVLSILRGGNRHNSTKDKVPEQIIASISPTSSEDNVDCPITPEDMELLYRWQTARMQGGNNRLGSPMRTPLGKKNYEDVLSITSSCGDKTVPMDNRRRHRSMVSF
eukprot:CAMPEP_0172316450 /NCGR_PEP_ID=MMETSP1058-20130122/28248_1 /TAXON_ID=83371 /ORGANISM="Detonula confervacea, Strain CCMP 353" /LENGTH=558 /DNA_ID=CAMNT_0013030759 /DNA_START=99 /DNA_END=1775 /DNA_ORIENTATION=-